VEGYVGRQGTCSRLCICPQVLTLGCHTVYTAQDQFRCHWGYPRTSSPSLITLTHPRSAINVLQVLDGMHDRGIVPALAARRQHGTQQRATARAPCVHEIPARRSHAGHAHADLCGTPFCLHAPLHTRHTHTDLSGRPHGTTVPMAHVEDIFRGTISSRLAALEGNNGSRAYDARERWQAQCTSHIRVGFTLLNRLQIPRQPPLPFKCEQ
jgi:hypothetical protein